MTARQTGNFMERMATCFSALAVAACSMTMPASAATLFDTMQASGDENVAVASGGYTGEVLFLGVKSLTVYQTVKVEGHTEDLVVSAADGCVYVTDRERSVIRVLDPSKAEVLGKVSLPPGTGPAHLAVSSNGDVLYVADELTGAVFRVQPRRGVYQLGTPALPGSRLQSIALTSDGQRLLMADLGLARIVVLNTNPFGLLADIPLNDGLPGRISTPPNDKFALVTDELRGSVAVVDLAHLVVSTHVAVQPGAFHTAIAPDGRAAYVSVWTTRAVFQINLQTWRSQRMADLAFSPGAMDVSPDGRYLIVTERLAALEHLIPQSRPVAVTLVDTRTGAIVRSAEFAGDPHAVRFLPAIGPTQPACPGFRNGEWALIPTSGVHHG